MLHPIDLMFHPAREEDRGTHGTHAVRHQGVMRPDHREARQKIQKSQRRQKQDYDLRLAERKHSVCDAVYSSVLRRLND